MLASVWCVALCRQLIGRAMGEAYLEPLSNVLFFAILKEALVVRDAVHTGTVASRISFCSLVMSRGCGKHVLARKCCIGWTIGWTNATAEKRQEVMRGSQQNTYDIVGAIRELRSCWKQYLKSMLKLGRSRVGCLASLMTKLRPLQSLAAGESFRD